MKKLLLIFILTFILIGCGYKPSISYASKQLEGKVFISVDINIDNATNSVLIKDELINLVITKFKLAIAKNKNEAQSFMSASLSSVTHKELLSDTSGFAKVYRQSVSIKISYNKKNLKEQTFTLNNYYDYSVDSDSTLTQERKDEATSIAISKALTNLFSKIAINSQK